MLDGMIIKPLRKLQDERGFFTEIFRKDWTDLLQDDNISQTNFSISYPNIIRAWHRHLKGQVDCFIVLKGALKICAYDEKTRELSEVISTAENPQIVKVPGFYWHGFKVVGNNLGYLVYFVNKLYEYSDPDEERRPWNDPNIIPESINGSTSDLRVGRPWDWNYLPHR